jgi:LysM repeat protein
MPRYVVPAALVALVVAVAVVIAESSGGSGSPSSPSTAGHTTAHHLPAFWTVRPGQTFSEIAAKTGMSVNQLEALNPSTDPYSLIPGERLRLRPYNPRPSPKHLGPRFWTVRSGQSFGSIAAKTGKNIITLEHLNPQLNPKTLQPGDRVRLRH